LAWQIANFFNFMRYNLAHGSVLLCFLVGWIFAGCKSVATTFHRMHDELTSELIKEDADEESHYYGAWFTWSPRSKAHALPYNPCVK
jgi:hypothetical protein